MVDIQCATAETRRGKERKKKERRKKEETTDTRGKYNGLPFHRAAISSTD